ncbi:MazG nucleotide pyrophosphohydrolase domain-containing protein [Photobacterium phosphoreum]|uniref:MazG nucleotide pyrophosphohydrolase domain-containing protein n=1 Tax=Photobacterium phosphoreum TaxID=659 RepID=UPI001E62C204|nr:MazG nucleotide pyrophosphohydrolase domain-containing protein [Photobacterium phosphoreum]
MKIQEITTINDYQNYFDNLYGAINKDRDINEIYGYLARTSGYLTRSVIKNKFDKKDIIRPLSWLFAVASKLDINVQDSFLKKFPTTCPYCLEKICCCFVTNKSPKDRDIAAYKIKKRQQAEYDRVKEGNFGEHKLTWAITNISNIYPNNEIIWHFSGPWMVCSKLFEEVAELHEAIDKYNLGFKTKENVEEEIADVFAWLISAWIGINKESRLDLTDIIIDYFLDDCPVCKKMPCECKFGDARIQGLVDIDKFTELKVLFDKLEKLSPNSDVKDLILSLEAVEKTQDGVVAQVTVNEVGVTLDNVKKGLLTTDGMTKSIASIIKSITAIFETFP